MTQNKMPNLTHFIFKRKYHPSIQTLKIGNIFADNFLIIKLFGNFKNAGMDILARPLT